MSTSITPETTEIVNQITSLKDIHMHENVLPDVLLDIVISALPEPATVQPEAPDPHELGGPLVLNEALVSGNFPFP